jgi:hypothetical protein
MFNKTTVLRHFFGGGWATDFGESADVAPDPSGRVVIPFLTEAQNCLYELDGGPHLIGGATKVNSSAVASGAVVTGVFDYWRHGTLGAPSRRRILHAGTTCLADTDDGTFSTTIGSGLESGKVPSYFTFDDLLIFSSDSTVDVPRSWDQTTAQALAGTPPRFSFGVAHKNRAWAAGVYANPSRLYYSRNTDPEDWTGSGSGSIDIDPNDGDMITGLVSHKDELFVFKGPNKGSIHRIVGSSPTGSDAFGRKNFVRGIGACWHNAIFPFGDDIGFVSQYGSIHSLSATAAYGDFFEGALSRPINRWINDHLNRNRMRYVTAATDAFNGFVLITMSIDANSTNNFCLAMDYRGAPNIIRWSRIPAYAMGSLSTFVDTNGVRRILGGGNDGFVRRLNVVDRSIDGATSMSYKVTTPFMNYGDPFMMKTLGAASIGLVPKGNFNTTFGWTRDSNTQQTYTTTQGGGTALDTFLLDSSTLGVLAGPRHIDRFMELNEGDEFRSVQFDVQQNAVNEDIELHSISAIVTPGAISTEN